VITARDSCIFLTESLYCDYRIVYIINKLVDVVYTALWWFFSDLRSLEVCKSRNPSNKSRAVARKPKDLEWMLDQSLPLDPFPGNGFALRQRFPANVICNRAIVYLVRPTMEC